MITTSDDMRRQTDVPDLIPARMLNEFAYCPRLSYLEWVQGEFAGGTEEFAEKVRLLHLTGPQIRRCCAATR